MRDFLFINSTSTCGVAMTSELFNRLLQEGAILATNEYEMGHHDGMGPTWRQRFWAWLAGLVIPS